MEMIGRRIGHYRVLEKLGEGGMGEVYLAEDTSLKRKVALKVLPADLASSRERLERFRREAESLAALNHPNIVHVYSVEAAEDVHFITMELVEGESLGELIPAEGLPLDQFFDLAIPLADALSEAHEQGIVHRDLKPSNVMVDGKGRPKILDFGLAKLRRQERSAEFSELPTEVMTEEGKVLGTYPYMSPEQVEGKAVDHRSDIFSFGTMLYEMATGHRPFRGDSPASMMSAILRDIPSAVDAERQELPHQLGRIVGRCLEKQADDRYQRARDLARDLEELREEVRTGGGVARRPTDAAAGGRSWLRGAAVLALVLLVAVVTFFQLRPREGPSEAQLFDSLAVLPLENISGDPELDYYAAGITEGLISELGRVGSLRVISRRSVMRYLGSDMSLPEIAGELGVDAVIEGSVLPAGDRVQVTAQLVQANPEQQLWAETYERDAKDVLALLRDVTAAIVNEVQVAVSPDELTRQAASREVDPEAHRLYLKAVQAKSADLPETQARVVPYLRQAVAIDAEFAEAWAQLADELAAQAIYGLPIGMEAERAAAVEEMWAALDRALALNPSSSEAHLAKGFAHMFLEWDWIRAENALLRAVELSPSDPESRAWYAGLLVALGRSDEALSQVTIAESLDPFSAEVLHDIGWVLYWVHDFERSLEYYDRALDLAPDRKLTIIWRGFAYAALGMDEETVRTWQLMHGWAGNYELAAAFEGRSLDENNRIWLDWMSGLDKRGFGIDLIATTYAQLGEYDKAMEWLEKGYATKGDPGKTAGFRFPFMKVDPIFDGLRGDPRFEDLLERMNLAD